MYLGKEKLRDECWKQQVVSTGKASAVSQENKHQSLPCLPLFHQSHTFNFPFFIQIGFFLWSFCLTTSSIYPVIISISKYRKKEDLLVYGKVCGARRQLLRKKPISQIPSERTWHCHQVDFLPPRIYCKKERKDCWWNILNIFLPNDFIAKNRITSL